MRCEGRQVAVNRACGVAAQLRTLGVRWLAFACAARGFRFGSDCALSMTEPPSQRTCAAVCGTGAVLKTGLFTQCPSVLGVENY
jgi:hypothetical protein